VWRICSQCGLRGDEAVCPDCNVELETIREHTSFPGRLWPGHVIRDQYDVGALIGVGGMGAVYRGRHRITRQDVGIKVLWSDLAENTAEVRRFTREARAASVLTHPNTVRVYDFGRDDRSGAIFMIMEFLDGQKLSDVLRETPVMPAERAVHIVSQVCKSLEEAHRKGIVHRDLKPDNIFLQEVPGENDFVKVLDFGLAKFVTGDVERDSLTRSGYVVGSPEYMAPEQAIGSDVGPAADIYAAGIMLYEMLSGDLPFDAETTAQVLRKHILEGPPRMHAEGGAAISPALERVVMRCLEKDPADRPPSAEALRVLLLQAYDRRRRREPIAPVVPLVLDVGDTTTIAKPAPAVDVVAPGAIAGEILRTDGRVELVEPKVQGYGESPEPEADRTARMGRATQRELDGAPRADLPAWILVVAGAAGAAVLMAVVQYLMS
jgi:serine/threonine protein kinase